MLSLRQFSKSVLAGGAALLASGLRPGGGMYGLPAEGSEREYDLLIKGGHSDRSEPALACSYGRRRERRQDCRGFPVHRRSSF